MFLKAIQLDDSSYIEFSDRITGDGKKLQITLRGMRNDKSVTMMSAVLEHADVALISQIITEWMQQISKE
jgi:hypothetical protein